MKGEGSTKLEVRSTGLKRDDKNCKKDNEQGRKDYFLVGFRTSYLVLVPGFLRK